jgi:glycosyltransferase involved in cell wall biosynthesis
MNRLLGNRLNVIFSEDYVPPRVTAKLRAVMGEHAIGMRGEKRIGPNSIQGFANRRFRLVYQPGILRTIAETRPDVLVGDGFYQWTSFALAYRLRYGMPLVVCYERTCHTERHAQWARTFYRRQVLSFVDAMAVNGSLSMEYSKWLGMPAERITAGQMVADTSGLSRAASGVTPAERVALREKWGNPELVFLCTGQLIDRKGVGQLLRGWSRLEQEGSGNWRLLLVGGGPREAELKAQARSLNLRRVVFAGVVDYDAIAPYYASADAFVMPTLEDNWSLVVPEAMACGLPILCSKYNGCYPELVEPDGNGWVFDPLDEQGTFEALRRCIANRDRLPAMGARSREIVAGHTPAHAAEAILKACRIAVENRGKKG